MKPRPDDARTWHAMRLRRYDNLLHCVAHSETAISRAQSQATLSIQILAETYERLKPEQHRARPPHASGAGA
jgi:hypothetical protein